MLDKIGMSSFISFWEYQLTLTCFCGLWSPCHPPCFFLETSLTSSEVGLVMKNIRSLGQALTLDVLR
jgi:hypothetical protein